MPGDKLSYTPKDRRTGQKHEIAIPPFCLTNFGMVRDNILEYINLSKKDYMNMLKNIGGITWEIVSMAMKYAETRKVKFLLQIHLSKYC